MQCSISSKIDKYVCIITLSYLNEFTDLSEMKPTIRKKEKQKERKKKLLTNTLKTKSGLWSVNMQLVLHSKKILNGKLVNVVTTTSLSKP